MQSKYLDESSLSKDITPVYSAIRFGDGVAFVPKDRELVYKVRETLNKLCGFPEHYKHFIGALPVALTRSNFHLLRGKKSDIENDSTHKVFQLPSGKSQDTISPVPQSTYWASKKLDGERFLLMFAKLPEPYNYPVQVLFDRKNSPLMIKLYAPEHLHDGAVFDGELVEESTSDGKKQFVYHIFDVIAVARYNFRERCLQDRLLIIERILPYIKPCPESRESPFIIKGKRFVPLKDIRKYIIDEGLPYLDNKSAGGYGAPCHGFILIEGEAGISTGTSYKQFKMKSAEDCTCELLLKMDRGACELYATDTESGGRLVTRLYTIQSIRDTFPDKYSKESKRSTDGPMAEDCDNRVIECRYFLDTRLFQFLKLRPDKKYPNHIKTLEDTIQAIKDNITVADLVRLAEEKDTA